MAPVRDDEKPNMATNVVAAGSEEPDESDREPSPPPSRSSSASDASFFAIYKKGQGYWTRMLTAGGVLLILLLTAQFLYGHALAALVPEANKRLMIAGAFTAVVCVLAWWAMNKPTSVDFLIATDSEMKKVNWTSRAELMGSTKVVIAFMFIISGVLFGIDLLFGYFFYWISVLKFPPL
jgi:preprotein translocase subunit SecE